MNDKIGKLAFALVAVGLAGCSAETRCRDGVTEMKGEMIGVIGSSDHKDAADPTVAAHTQLDIAQNMMLTGNFEGCVEHLGEARKLLESKKSK